jgi:hypothetical protein
MRSRSFYRFALGLGQGAALSFLYLAYDARTWPATDGMVFAPLLLVALFMPLLVLQALGNLRPLTLCLWAAVATAAIAALSYYDIWRVWPVDWVVSGASPDWAWQPHLLPSWPFVLALAAMLFIAHAMIVSADADSRFIAHYAIYFDVAWEQAIQIALTAIFVIVFWALLWLGAGLFALVKVDFLSRLFRHEWFWIPATTLAIAIAIHMTSARVGLVRGTRILALTLLSLLLPLMTLILVAFLGALAVQGLEPLWKTRHAAALLLLAAAVILVLINAAYQDGTRDRRPSSFLRLPASIAALIPVPLVVLAGYALALRTTQYGWTVFRVIAAGVVVIAACHAVGYAWASLARPWLKPIEKSNIYCAFVALVVLLALLSPLADPARISVDDQLARVADGRMPADKLDLDYLRWDAGRYGKAALESLAARRGQADAPIRDAASRLLDAKYRYQPAEASRPIASNLIVHAADGTLPKSFLEQDWRAAGDPSVPLCLRTVAAIKCDAFVKDLRGDGSAQILVVQGAEVTGFDQDAAGKWRVSGRWLSSCPDGTRALHEGQFAAAAPEPPAWPDLDVAGRRLRFAQPNAFGPVCPKS